MTYQVLARKWRPGNFNDMVGQSHVLNPLAHALDNQRLHHAYLFTGTRGVGKTTLARILAKCLNCEKGVSSTPCGECDSCVEIAEGRFIDLIEVDAASRTKVEDMRELLENVQYAPSRGRFKIYLIDEVHMLSNHSFNALLKTLEEPPPHIKFLFATTDPQKLPITILSRCLQFNLKNLSPQLIENYLQDILGQESIDFEESALWQIASAAAGSMRDALTLLDQAISFCEGKVTAEGVAAMLGIPDGGVIQQLLACLIDRDAAALLHVVEQVAEHAPDFGQLLESTLGTLHRIAIAQVLPDAIDNSYGDQQQVKDFAGQLTAEDVQLYYQVCLKGKEELALASDQRAMFEMLMIRMLTFTPDATRSSSQELPSTSPRSTKAPVKPEVSGPAQKKKNLKPDVDSKPPPVPVSQPASEAPIPVDEEVCSDVVTSNHVPEKPDVFPVAGALSAPAAEAMDNQKWNLVCTHLKVAGITGNIMANCVFESFAKGNLILVLDENQSAIYNEEHKKRIEDLLRDYFKSDLILDIKIGSTELETPAAISQRIKQEKISDMQHNFIQDENVQNLLNEFSGEVLKDTISSVK